MSPISLPECSTPIAADTNMAFNPCQGKSACRDDGHRCLTCGRSFEEIRQLRSLLDQLCTLAIENNYDNVGAFSRYVSRKMSKMIAYRRENHAD